MTGRDNKYRPIIVIDLKKIDFSSNNEMEK